MKSYFGANFFADFFMRQKVVILPTVGCHHHYSFVVSQLFYLKEAFKRNVDKCLHGLDWIAIFHEIEEVVEMNL